MVRVASRNSIQTMTKLVASQARTTTIHPIPTCESCGNAEKAEITFGSTK